MNPIDSVDIPLNIASVCCCDCAWDWVSLSILALLCMIAEFCCVNEPVYADDAVRAFMNDALCLSIAVAADVAEVPISVLVTTTFFPSAVYIVIVDNGVLYMLVITVPVTVACGGILSFIFILCID